MEEIHCKRCGGKLKKEGGNYRCESCGAEFTDGSEAITKLLDEQRERKIANLRALLYDAVHEKNQDDDKIISACCELKKYLPDDFQANFYEIAVSPDSERLNHFLLGIDVKENAIYIPDVMEFVLRSFKKSNITYLKLLAERAFQGEARTKYYTLIEEEAKKVEDGLYEPSLIRHVFVAHSSADYSRVLPIVEELEKRGFKCFVAQRNLRHGRGAVKNYATELETAMRSTQCFVFFSSKNSRKPDCEAITREIPYVRDNLPHCARMEYILDDYTEEDSAVKQTLSSFFSVGGYCSQCRSQEDLEKWLFANSMQGGREKPAVKYCLSCGAENAVGVKFCGECGGKVFVPTKDEYYNNEKKRAIAEALKKERAEFERERQKEREELDRKLKDEREAKARAEQESERARREKARAEREAETVRQAKTRAEEEKALAAARRAQERTECKEAKRANAKWSGKRRQWIAIIAGTILVLAVGLGLGLGFLFHVDKVVIDNLLFTYSRDDGGYIVSQSDSKLSGSIVIPKTCKNKQVVKIADSAFSYCSSITSVKIPDSVTSVGKMAFYHCSKLTSITIPNGVTSIGSWAFEDCSSLTSVKIPASVKSIGGDAFKGCFIEEATIPAIACRYISNSKLKTVTITGGGAIADGAFKECALLSFVTIEEGVTSIGKNAFYGCSSLISITISDSVRSIGNRAFYDCSLLISITIPDSVTSIGASAFYDCPLTSVNITDLTAWCKISFEDRSANPLDYAHNLYLNHKLVTELVIPDGVTSIGNKVFHGCYSLKSVKIPDGVRSIGSSAFEHCRSLKSVTIPDSVTEIGGCAFWGCDSLTSVTIPDSVTWIGDSAFSSCDSLTSVTISDGVRSIGSSAFAYCSSLKSVTIPDSVPKIGKDAFNGCTSLTIYCEASKKPSGWDEDWNSSGRPVVWGYEGD